MSQMNADDKSRSYLRESAYIGGFIIAFLRVLCVFVVQTNSTASEASRW